jgi:Rod binding domain-containing protein
MIKVLDIKANNNKVDVANTIDVKEFDKAIAAAKDFESLLIEQMLKTMRQSSDFGSDLLKSNEEDLMTEMFDKEMAKNISSSKGIGLSEMLLKQFSDK